MANIDSEMRKEILGFADQLRDAIGHGTGKRERKVKQIANALEDLVR